MANNCLQTKLKSVVQNDNLNKLGCIKFVSKASVNGTYISILTNSPSTVLVSLKNGTLSNSRTFYATASTKGPIISDSGADVLEMEANNKYNITTLYDVFPMYGLKEISYLPVTRLGNTRDRVDANLKEAIKSFDFNELSTLQHPELIDEINYDFMNTGQKLWTGDISAISSCTNLTKLTLMFTNIGGELAALGNMTKLSKITLFNCNISGSVESFVQAQRGQGRFSTDNDVTFMCSNATFNGETLTQVDHSLSWTASTITLDGVTIDA